MLINFRCSDCTPQYPSNRNSLQRILWPVLIANRGLVSFLFSYNGLNICSCKAALDDLVLMQQLQDVTLQMTPGYYAESLEGIIMKATRQLQTLYERNGGKKQIRVINSSFYSGSYLSQTITIPANRRNPAS